MNVSKQMDRKVTQYGRDAAAMLALAKGKARHWTVYTAAAASGFTMATTAEASLLVGTPAAGTSIGVGGSLNLSNAVGTDSFARVNFSTSSVIVFEAIGGGGRGFLGTNSALMTFGAPDEVSLVDPAVGTVTFNSTTNNLPRTGIIGLRTGTNANAVTGFLDFTIDFTEMKVTVNNFWYDADASDGTARLPEPGTLGLLALGAVGVTATRNRRQRPAPATS